MTLPTVFHASYAEAKAFATLHHDEVFHEPTAIAAEALFADLDAAKISNLGTNMQPKRYGFFLKAEEEIVGWHIGRQQSAMLFSMDSSGILEAHQGQGYYKYLLDAVVRHAREEGYAGVVSTHAADNNRILAAKLRYGFLIKGVEINPLYGLDIKLIYYFNDAQKRAHSLRVGSQAHF